MQQKQTLPVKSLWHVFMMGTSISDWLTRLHQPGLPDECEEIATVYLEDLPASATVNSTARNLGNFIATFILGSIWKFDHSGKRSTPKHLYVAKCFSMICLYWSIECTEKLLALVWNAKFLEAITFLYISAPQILSAQPYEVWSHKALTNFVQGSTAMRRFCYEQRLSAQEN